MTFCRRKIESHRGDLFSPKGHFIKEKQK